LKDRKERIQINKKFAIDYHVLHELRSRDRKFPFVLNPVNEDDLEKLKLKPDVRIIEIKEVWKIGEEKKEGINPHQH